MMPNIQELATTLVKFVNANAPTILTVTAVAGVVGTALVTFNEAPKAKEVIKDMKEDLDGVEEKKERNEIIFKAVKRVGLHLVPIVITAGLSIASIISLNKIHAQRYAAVSAAYAIADQSLKEWRKHTEEVVGPKKTEEIKMAIADEKAKQISEKDISEIQRENETAYDPVDLVIDTCTGVKFYSNMSKIRDAFTTLGTELSGCDWMCINDLYSLLGLRKIKLGQDLGWNNVEMSYKLGPGPIKIGYDTTYSSTENDRPCIMLSYNPETRLNSFGDRYSY